MKVVMCRYIEQPKETREQLIDNYLLKLRPIIESQIETEHRIATINLHVFTDTQIQTMTKIFSEYNHSSPFYQAALDILKN